MSSLAKLTNVLLRYATGGSSLSIARRVGIVARRHGVAVPDLSIGAVDDHLAATGVADDLTGAVDAARLGVGRGQRPGRGRRGDVPTAVGTRHNMALVAGHRCSFG